MAEPVLELRGVTCRYGSVTALDQVDLDVAPGTVHALIGENGAGKSTLVNVVAGLRVPDEGSVKFQARPLPDGGPCETAAAGVGVVHQHFSLVDTLTVAENFLLGRSDSSFIVDIVGARQLIAEWSERSQLPVNPDRRAEELSVAEKQCAEIVTALAGGASLLLLDEPTAVLSPLESDALLDTVRALADSGLSIVLVSHKLREVEQVADEVTVLRAGKVTGRHRRGTFDRHVLAAEMIGTGRCAPPLRTGKPGDVRLQLRNVSAGRLRDLDLEVRAGEVVGIAAVAGNGQTELARLLAGLEPPLKGDVLINGKRVNGSAGDAAAAGVAFIPEDRGSDGLALALPLWKNVIAKRANEVAGPFGLDHRKVNDFTQRVLAKLGVRPADPKALAASLSGGNQQRLVLGRELDGTPRVVVAAEPTRGLDPASTLDVISALQKAADEGAAVIAFASDLDELFALSGRIIVLYDGHIVLDIARASADRETIGRAMVGA